MADLKTTIDLIFRGNDQVSPTLAGLSKDLNTLSGSVQSAAQPFASLTKGVLAFEAALLTTGAAVIGFAVNTARDFELAFREIATLIDEPVEALQGFRQEILDYASTSTASLDQITGSVYAAISAGTDYTDSLAFVRQAEQLSIAGKADLQATTVALASALNAYAEGADEAARFSDVLFNTVRLGQTTIPELAASLATVTGTAADAQVPFEEVGAAIAALTATGVPTSEAITQIRAALASFIKPSAEATRVAEELGINFDLSTIRSQGLAGALETVAEASGGNAEILARLFGRVEALGAVLTLTGTGADKFATSLEQVADGAGATEAAVAKFEGVVGRSGNALEGFLVEMGTPFLDTFADAKAAIGGLIDAVTDNLGTADSGLNDLRQLLVGYAEDLLTVLETAAQNLPDALAQADYSDFEQGLQAVVESVRNLFGEFDLTSTQGLVTAIETVGAGFLALSNISAGAIDALKPFFEAAVSVANGILNLDSALFSALGTIGGFSIALTTLLPALDSVLLAVIALNSAKGLGALSGTLGGVTDALARLIPLLGKAGLVGAAGAAGFAFGSWLDDTVNVSGALGGLIDKVTGLDRQTAAALAPVRALTEEERRLRDEAAALADQYQALLDRGDSLQPELVNLAKGFETTGKATNLTRQEFDALLAQSEVEQRMRAISEAAVEQGGAMEETASKADLLKQAQQGLIPLTDELIEYWRGGPAQAAKLSEATGTLAEQLDAMAASGEIAGETVAELRTELEKEEIRARVELETAQLDADVERVKAQIEGVTRLAQIKASVDIAEIEAGVTRSQQLFDSLNTSSTNLTGIFGDLTDAIVGVDDADRNARQKLEIFQSAQDRLLDIFDEQTEIQREVSRAQIAELQARARRLRSGEALITINGDGLEPELEAFMYRILENIQLRANADGQAFLLGI